MAKKSNFGDIITSDSAIIRIERKEFKGKKYVDIRKMYLSKEDNEFRPTQKGIMIPEDKFEAVQKALNKI